MYITLVESRYASNSSECKRQREKEREVTLFTDQLHFTITSLAIYKDMT